MTKKQLIKLDNEIMEIEREYPADAGHITHVLFPRILNNKKIKKKKL